MTIRKYTYRFDELTIRPEDMILGIGYPRNVKPPEMVCRDIDEVLAAGAGLCSIEGGIRSTGPITWNGNDYSMAAENTAFHIKKIVFQQMKKSTSIALFVCTAGRKISDEVKRFTREGDLLKAFIYDTFGSIVVESAMDKIQDDLRKTMAADGLNITNRFSPGYCGWDVSEQHKLFSLLPERFCGIELTESALMKPEKSVSGIIGIGPSVKFNPYSCTLCDMTDCIHRNLQRT